MILASRYVIIPLIHLCIYCWIFVELVGLEFISKMVRCSIAYGLNLLRQARKSLMFGLLHSLLEYA